MSENNELTQIAKTGQRASAIFEQCAGRSNDRISAQNFRGTLHCQSR